MNMYLSLCEIEEDLRSKTKYGQYSEETQKAVEDIRSKFFQTPDNHSVNLEELS